MVLSVPLARHIIEVKNKQDGKRISSRKRGASNYPTFFTNANLRTTRWQIT